jgi:CHASE3 domain sensor protein
MEFPGLLYIVFAWLACFVAVRIGYYFISKRKPSLSEYDKSLGHFAIATVFYIILVFISYIYIGSIVPSFSITPRADQPIEAVVQELVKNQQEMSQQLRAFKDILSFLLLMTGLHLMSAFSFFQEWRNERKKLSAPPAKTRPLGLDLD